MKNKKIVFVLGLLIDAFAIALSVKIFIGASPFGSFVDNAVQIFPLTPGTISFVYSTLTLFLVKYINKEKFYYQGLIYNFLFAFVLDFWFLIIPDLIFLDLVVKVLIGLISVVLADISKYFLTNGQGPKLPTVVLINAISEKFQKNKNFASKTITITTVLLSVLMSFFHNEGLFYQVGFFTLMHVFFTGNILDFLEKRDFLNIKK